MNRSLFLNIPQPALLIHPSDKGPQIVDVNHAFQSVFGRLLPDIQNLPLSYSSFIEHCLPHCKDDLLESLNLTLNGPDPNQHPDNATICPFLPESNTPNERVRYFNVHCSAYSDDKGRPTILQTFEDVTDYILRERDSDQHIAYQNRLLQVSNDIVTKLFATSDWNDELYGIFEFAGKAVKADRVYYFSTHLHPKSGRLLCSQQLEWSADEIEPQQENSDLQNIPVDHFHELFAPLKENTHLSQDVRELNDGLMKEILSAQNIRSLLLVPLFVQSKFYGFVGFDDCTTYREWSSQEIRFLRTIAVNLSHAIERRL
jgi:hypothetical protein